MANLTIKRTPIDEVFRVIALPLAAQSVFQGGGACIDVATATCKKMASGNTNLVRVGNFEESADNTGALAPYVLVRLDFERFGTWYDSATGGGAVTVSNLFADVYMLDDHTVTTSSSGNAKAGRVWKVDTVKGVLVESQGRF